jgi:1-acyl-sn-glycerol-3-phosphate acyltransferase
MSSMVRKAIRKTMGHSLLRVMGWRFEGNKPEGFDKFVIVAAPHTSNWDLPLMLACAYISDTDISWLGKHTLFRSFGGPFFTWLGGIPVDRTASRGMVQQVVDVFNRSEHLALAVSPTGTRKKISGWKTGFYYIAHGSKVPIVLSYLDFKTKRAGFGPAIVPSGDVEADFEKFRAFYEGKQGKYPEQDTPVVIRAERTYEPATEREGVTDILKDAYDSVRSTEGHKAKSP